MDSSSLNQYEERLYSVFKTFDVDNEEALNKAAVLALCDALQLEQRGAALVDTLFERRDQRVTFAQFRSGLLAVLGEPPPRAPTPPPASDDDSSGREAAPRLVLGSKRYGRRSRPPRAPPARAPPADPPLEHDATVDCERALQLCRRLHMDGIDRRLVESIFESVPTAETTVGDFFDRLNSSLTTSIHDAVSTAGGEAPAGPASVTESGGAQEGALPVDLLVEAWERAGVQRPRRLLAELGFEGTALSAAALERALDDELEALSEPPDARALLLLAALALTRLRLERVRCAAAAANAERDRLRADLDDANRRAAVLAQEVDENHARLEAELTADLRRAEARHAERLRAAEAERAGERERAHAERASIEAELARRADVEQRLRSDADSSRERAREAEARAAAAEQRAAAAERERARLAAELRLAAERAGGERGQDEAAAAALAARVEELRQDNTRLRDRCDELAAALELLEARGAGAPAQPAPHTWHEEAGGHLRAPGGTALDNESPPVSLEATVAATPQLLSEAAPPDATSDAPDELAALRERLAEAEARHHEEKARLDDSVKELESSLEQMRVEYERCEEYWSGKLEEERALLAEEQRAGDERLAELVAKVGEYERQYARAPRLPAIPEAPALERQAAELDAELARARTLRAELQRRAELLQRRDAELQRRDLALQRRERELARLAAAVEALRPAAGEAGLRARLQRAEAGAARLAARLAAADLLVKDLYVENCLLGPAPRRL